MDIFATQTLRKVVRSLDVPSTFLLGLFFPTITEHNTEEILFDTTDGKPRLTPFVAPEKEGKVVQSKGHKTDMFKPAYIKDKRVFKPGQALKRAIGENFGSDLSPEERRAITLREQLTDMMEMKQRRMEWMAAQAVLNGQVTVSGEDYPTTVVNFGRDSALSKTLTTTARWGESGVSPVDDLEGWIDEMHDTGGASASIIVVDTKALNYLKADPKFKDAIDTRRGGESNADLGLVVRGQGDNKARFIGRLGDVEIWKYQELYLDESGTQQKLIPDNTVLIANPQQVEGEQAYGAILDEDVLVPLSEHVKSWVQQDPSVRYVLLQSAPLTVPYRPNATMRITVR